MKTVAQLASVIPILFVAAGCGHGGGFFSGRNLRTGSSISEHDRRGGVVQVAPGIQDTAIDSSGFIVPETKSLLRFKAYDDPVPHPATAGLVQLLVEYRTLRAFLPESRELPDVLRLTVSKIEVKKRPVPRAPGLTERPWLRNRESDIVVIQPDIRSREVEILRGHAFFAVLKGITLPAGDYEWVRVTFAQSGIAEVGNNDFRALVTGALVYDKPFKVVAGKITALHTKPEHDDDVRESAHLRKHRHPDFHPPCQTGRVFPVRLTVEAGAATVKPPIDKIFLSISQVRAANQVLNDVRTVIELLELRGGAVALLGHNLLDAGTYSMFQLVLAGEHTVQDADGEHPLRIFDGNESVVEVSGPFELRGGRITELFLEFDPNTCIFFTSSGYVLDPDVRVASVLSMTPVQENRLVQALGPRANVVADSAEVAFEGTVETTTVVAGNLPRTRVSLHISDRLRGIAPAMETLQLQVPGGTVNGLNLRVYGMPQFSQNERVILFLKQIGNEYGIVEGEYGKVNL